MNKDKHSPFHHDEIEEVREEVLKAIKENVTGYLYLGSMKESLRAGYDEKSDGGIIFKHFFSVYCNALDVQVDERGYVI